jgi:tripartite-type tricarboxylate transporter receptor subunit TctC
MSSGRPVSSESAACGCSSLSTPDALAQSAFVIISNTGGDMMRLATQIALAFVLFGLEPALAQSWPERPIRAFIPFSAGSATDVIPRVVFEELAGELGQPIVVENRGGAGGTLGVGAVVAAAPDGYTILANSSAHTVAPWIVANLPYNVATDLRAVAALGQNANVLVVSPAKGWHSAQDLVAAARARPGTFNYGSAGVGTATHISAERFRLAAKFEAVHVPYKGGPEALADVLAGRVDFYYCPISTAIPLISEGRLLALAVSTPARAAALPEVPTSLEAGFPDSDYTVWYGVFMPARTAQAVVDKFHAATMKVLASPVMREKLAKLAVDPLPMTPAQFDKRVTDELAANEVVIKSAGIR